MSLSRHFVFDAEYSSRRLVCHVFPITPAISANFHISSGSELSLQCLKLAFTSKVWIFITNICRVRHTILNSIHEEWPMSGIQDFYCFDGLLKLRFMDTLIRSSRLSCASSCKNAVRHIFCFAAISGSANADLLNVSTGSTWWTTPAGLLVAGLLRFICFDYPEPIFRSQIDKWPQFRWHELSVDIDTQKLGAIHESDR